MLNMLLELGKKVISLREIGREYLVDAHERSIIDRINDQNPEFWLQAVCRLMEDDKFKYREEVLEKFINEKSNRKALFTKRKNLERIFKNKIDSDELLELFCKYMLTNIDDVKTVVSYIAPECYREKILKSICLHAKNIDFVVSLLDEYDLSHETQIILFNNEHARSCRTKNSNRGVTSIQHELILHKTAKPELFLSVLNDKNNHHMFEVILSSPSFPNKLFYKFMSNPNFYFVPYFRHFAANSKFTKNMINELYNNMKIHNKNISIEHLKGFMENPNTSDLVILDILSDTYEEKRTTEYLLFFKSLDQLGPDVRKRISHNIENFANQSDHIIKALIRKKENHKFIIIK
jgi:hypothetical protein